MSKRVVYEVSLTVPEADSVELGAWLPGHIDDMLALPGFIEAHQFDPERVADNKRRHTVHYVVSDREALDQYLTRDAERMRAPALERFGERLHSERSIRAIESSREANEERCLNCSAALNGQYCWNCGQRGNTRLISLFELLRDAFGDMFELDSRLWRTLLPLLRRPGYLTAEYLRGRRARFMPPFRMYLVLSFLFFLTARGFGDGALQFSFDEEGAASSADEAVVTEPTAGADSAGAAENDCDINIGKTGVGWIDERMTAERLNNVCEQIKADKGQRFAERLAQNLPAAALALLPLLALLLKSLYPLSRRYYVEHLLLLVHYHSFVFLILSFAYLYNNVVALLSPPNWLLIVPNILVGLYIPLYLYKAMRRVYQQGRLVSIFKYLLLLGGYLAAIIAIMLGMLIYVILTY